MLRLRVQKRLWLVNQEEAATRSCEHPCCKGKHLRNSRTRLPQGNRRWWPLLVEDLDLTLDWRRALGRDDGDVSYRGEGIPHEVLDLLKAWVETRSESVENVG